MASTLAMNSPTGSAADPHYKPMLKPMAPRRQLGKISYQEQDIIHMRKQLSGEAEGGVLGYLADHYRPDYGKHTPVVEQLRFSNLDLSALLSDRKSFGALQKSLRKQGAITNQLLEQGLSFFIMNNRAFLMQRLEQQRREEQRRQRMLEEQALLNMLEEENRKYEREMQRMKSKDYNPDEDHEEEEESESIRQAEGNVEEGTLFSANSPSTSIEQVATAAAADTHTSTTPTALPSPRVSTVPVLAEGVGSIAKQQQTEIKLDMMPSHSGRNYLMFAQTLGGGLGQIELDDDDDDDDENKENAEEQKRQEEWQKGQKEREAEIKRLREKVAATKKMREKLAAAKKLRQNADRKKQETIKNMSAADKEESKKTAAKPRRSISREAALDAMKDSGSEAAMKQMREKMASYKKKRPTASSSSGGSAGKLSSLSETKSTSTPSKEEGEASREKLRSIRKEKSASNGLKKTSSETSVSKDTKRSSRGEQTESQGLKSSSDSGHSKEKPRGIRRHKSSELATSARRNSHEKSDDKGPPLRRNKSLSSNTTREALVADAVKRVTEAKKSSKSETGATSEGTTKRTQRKPNYGRLSVNVQVLKDTSMQDGSAMSASSLRDNSSAKEEEEKTDA